MRQRWLQKMRKKLVAKSTKFQNTASTDSHGIEKGKRRGGGFRPSFFLDSKTIWAADKQAKLFLDLVKIHLDILLLS